jgi:hypothetical protein
LDGYRWAGHAVLLGCRDFQAQDADAVLSRFGARVSAARTAYREFVQAGVAAPRPDLSGGGLRRSAGKWEHRSVVARGREGWTHDERILGSSEFVAAVIDQSSSAPPPPVPTDVIPGLLRAVATRCEITPEEIASSSLRPRALVARAIICQFAVCRRGLSLRAVARALGISKQSVARAVARRAAVALDIDDLDLDPSP